MVKIEEDKRIKSHLSKRVFDESLINEPTETVETVKPRKTHNSAMVWRPKSSREKPLSPMVAAAKASTSSAIKNTKIVPVSP